MRNEKVVERVMWKGVGVRVRGEELEIRIRNEK